MIYLFLFECDVDGYVSLLSAAAAAVVIVWW